MPEKPEKIQAKSAFVSAVLGAVSHPTNILTEYLSLFRGVKKYKAYILSWLDGWIHKKLREGKPSWVYVVNQDLADALGCCRDTVQRHLSQLCKMGLLLRTPFKRWATDHIFAYTINVDALLAYQFQAFTQAISRSAVIAKLWIGLLFNNAEIQTSESLNSDSGLPENQQPEVGSSATNTNASIDLLNPSTNDNSVVEEEEDRCEIRKAIADAPFAPREEEESPPQTELSSRDKSSAPPTETLANNSQITLALRRLRLLRIPSTKQVESLIKKTPPEQLESNILALEEEAAAKGLDKPIAAFFAAVKNNWQPKGDKQSWWERAAVALGRERRDRLIACVTELNRQLVVCFSNGQQIPFEEAVGMTWDAIALFGGGA